MSKTTVTAPLSTPSVSVVDRTAEAMKRFNPDAVKGLDLLPIVVRHEDFLGRAMTQEQTTNYAHDVVAYIGSDALENVVSGDGVLVPFYEGLASLVLSPQDDVALRDLFALAANDEGDVAFSVVLAAALKTLRAEGSPIDADVRRILAMNFGETIVITRPEWGPVLAEDWEPSEGEGYERYYWRIVVKATEYTTNPKGMVTFTIEMRSDDCTWSTSDLGLSPDARKPAHFELSADPNAEEVAELLDIYRRVTEYEAATMRRASQGFAKVMGITYEHLCSGELTEDCRALIAEKTEKVAA